MVDIVNNPNKYKKIHAVDNLIKTIREITIRKYGWLKVSDAIEVLKYNGHVTDTFDINEEKTEKTRIITLTDKGAIDYRNQVCLKQSLNDNVIQTNKMTWVNIIAAIIFGLVVSITQIRSCNRDIVQDRQ